MNDLVDVLIEDVRWNSIGLTKLAESSVKSVLSIFDLDSDSYAVSLLGCDDARIAGLNNEFRAKTAPTNVLSWPASDLGRPKPDQPPYLPPNGSSEKPYELGDIAISFDTCWRESKETGQDFTGHVAHLLVHGTLHLFGYDHIVIQEAAEMENLERQALAIMGYRDPYGDIDRL
ncbi:MAG: rRNA maturation RNase YbeY [Paracoccaceae bacterium]